MAARPVETADPTRGGTDRLRVAPHHIRTPLLNPRTLLGALLVTVSGLALFVAATGDEEDGTPVVVAARDLRPGQRIEPDDLAVAHGSLPDSVDTFTAIDQLDGRVALGPVGAGEIVPPAATSSDRQDGDVDTREV
ncbi:MAG: SAF domain-containing protein, partial [Actinomycetota bacterium]